MTRLTYDHAPVPVRSDLEAVHREIRAALAAPGTWLDAAARVAIAAEVRNAWRCRLCQERKAALSPFAVSGDHDHDGALPEALVDVVHRVATDPGRLSERWFRGILEQGVTVEEYVETVGTACTALAVDRFADVLGITRWPLPQAEPGAPSRRRPDGVTQGDAWVPWILPEDAAETEADLYVEVSSNVARALSLVPDTARAFFSIVFAHYLPGVQAMRDFGREFRAITHAQIELLAARVSAINQCAY